MANEPRFEVFEYKRDPTDPSEWGWRFRAGNGEIMANGEGYTRKVDAHRAVADLLRNLGVLKELSIIETK